MNNNEHTRIILFAGKGGVGKTSIASATGLKAAESGKKTLVMSLDSAHSLADIFDINQELIDLHRGEPIQITERLWIRELDVDREIHKHWGDVYRYFASLLNTSGLDEVLAEELAIIPGMEEVSSLLYINSYFKKREYDIIILDCAPTGESLRFVSIPTALEWYIKKIFNLERNLAKVVRPIARHITDVPIPEDTYFAALERLFNQLKGVDALLTNPNITTVRLVTNPEKIVLKETQRAYMYFCLYKMCIDAVIMNRILPDIVTDSFFEDWKHNQERYIAQAKEYFSPVPILPVKLFPREICGLDSLSMLSDSVYGDRNPTEFFYREVPYRIVKENSAYNLSFKLPFIGKENVEVNKIGDELIIRIGAHRRNILLPKGAVHLDAAKAHLKGDTLLITLGRSEHVQ